MWQVEVRHSGLNKFRLIKGADSWVVDQKAAALRAQWDAEWARRVEKDTRHANVFNGKQLASQRTRDAETALAALTNLLDDVSRSHALNWTALRLSSPFPEVKPEAPAHGAEPTPPPPFFPPALGKPSLLEHAVPALRRRTEAKHAAAVAELRKRDEQQRAQWEEECAGIRDRNRKKEAYYEAKLREWEANAAAHFEKEARHNARLEEMEASVAVGDQAGIIDRLSLAILLAKLPPPIGTEFEVAFSPEAKSAVVDYVLPAPNDMPTLKDVRYVQARDELVEKHVSEAELGRLYDATLYRAALGIIHIVFSSDPERRIERVTLNGWVDHVVKATGLDERTCVLSVGVNRSDFEKIELQRVDPRECFKSLKGVAASKLIGLAPVAPLERPALQDTRFIDSQDVASAVDETVNLAAMDWADFEHLVRQVFEHEFSSAGTEVRVTQASRDGGVDAIVHDPDPIKGGKIIIQAKRYTATVDVAAVRDLYGTLVNEGANKGILVTTSQFGPDARKFAQGKPITLIDGGNFLYLLEKMGVKARIDLREARVLAAAAQRN
jgi:restriction system protein